MTEKLPVIQLPGSRLHKIIPARKIKYGDKLKELLSEYSSCLLCDVTNVGSSQIAEMRKDFRGKARFLFGKNVRKLHILFSYFYFYFYFMGQQIKYHNKKNNTFFLAFSKHLIFLMNQ